MGDQELQDFGDRVDLLSLAVLLLLPGPASTGDLLKVSGPDRLYYQEIRS